MEKQYTSYGYKIDCPCGKGTLAMHWGIAVDSDVPVTGVIHNTNDAQWYIEDIMYNSIDLTCLECQEFNKADIDYAIGEDRPCDMCETSSHTLLVGDWKQDENGQYEPDREKENGQGYSAICGEIYSQIVWSKYTTRSALCSPCYPGQGDIGSEGEFLTYDLPPELYGSEE